ncbi:MAG: VOC family protein [Fluviicola sp.]|jgi:hypothetical protein
MTFRYARHTSNLKALEKFYTELVGLKKLGGFENHSSYNGIFLGDPAENWHLEFTTSNENPIHQFDEEDALVFYLENEMEFTQIKERISEHKIPLEKAKNPYWQENGLQISDPDGFKVIFSLKK